MVRCSGRHFGLEVAKSDGTTSETQSNKDDGEVPIKIPTHEEVSFFLRGSYVGREIVYI